MKSKNLAFILILLFNIYPKYSFAIDKKSLTGKALNWIKESLLRHSEKENVLPTKLSIEKNILDIQYTLDNKLTEFVKSYIKSHPSDFVSVVVIDNETGKILSAIDYSKKDKKFGTKITFSSTHPAASLFKIVTAAELLQNTNIGLKSKFEFTGNKHQLKDYSNYGRKITFDKAFAQSNNVIFGKAAIKNILGVSITKMANDFGFNKELIAGLNLQESIFNEPEDQYDLAQIASGFNQKTRISPVQGAVMASIVANDGLLKYPTLVSELSVKGVELWKSPSVNHPVMSKEVANDLKEMMALTIEDGTAKKSFRKALNHFPFNQLYIGGKTGSITGGEPQGKRDWFVAYAIPKDEKYGKGISLCVMIINMKKWYVKASFVAKNIIDYYFKHNGTVQQSLIGRDR